MYIYWFMNYIYRSLELGLFRFYIPTVSPDCSDYSLNFGFLLRNLLSSNDIWQINLILFISAIYTYGSRSTQPSMTKKVWFPRSLWHLNGSFKFWKTFAANHICDGTYLYFRSVSDQFFWSSFDVKIRPIRTSIFLYSSLNQKKKIHNIKYIDFWCKFKIFLRKN